MTEHVDQRMLQQLDLLRDLGHLTLDSAQALFGRQFASARSIVARSGDRLQDAGSGSASAILQAGFAETAEAAREAARLNAVMHLHAMRLLERQSREAQLILAAAESVLAAALPALAEAGDAAAKRRPPVAADDPPQRLAA